MKRLGKCKTTISYIMAVLAGMISGYCICKAYVSFKRKKEELRLWRANGCHFYYVTSRRAGHKEKGRKSFEVRDGDRFRVLDKCDNTILIEVLGDEHNPYLIPEDFAKSFSNYPDKPSPVMRRFLNYMGLKEENEENGAYVVER